jgi:hypothetical protein
LAALDAKMAEMEWAEQRVREELARRTGRPAGATSGAGGDAELEQLPELEVAERAASSALSADSQGRLDRLQQLADLRDRGVLSDSEFAAEKAKIMAED